MSSFYDRALPEGHSGYFSEPEPGLDPDLFDGMHLKSDVRIWLMMTLVHGLSSYLNLARVQDWLHAWLAGSGITYQWSGDRGLTGDLDVLFGVDMTRFVVANPDYQGVPERDVADQADRLLKQKLWPKTAHTRFGGAEHEVTFYWAPGIGQGIEVIHPYAAYDLKLDVWVVRPPQLPADPRSLYPDEWFDAAGIDTDSAGHLARRHTRLTERLAAAVPGSPSSTNIAAELGRVEQSATSLLADIHGGRRDAFGEQGHGYSDWHNFRWQHAKATGVVAGLKTIKNQAAQRAATRDQELYGGPIAGPEQILTRDMLRRDR